MAIVSLRLRQSLEGSILARLGYRVYRRNTGLEKTCTLSSSRVSTVKSKRLSEASALAPGGSLYFYLNSLQIDRFGCFDPLVIVHLLREAIVQLVSTPQPSFDSRSCRVGSAYDFATGSRRVVCFRLVIDLVDVVMARYLAFSMGKEDTLTKQRLSM